MLEDQGCGVYGERIVLALWRTRDPKDSRHVLVKIQPLPALTNGMKEARKRPAEEVQFAMYLNHPHIIARVYGK